MKVHFTASLRGDKEVYNKIVGIMKDLGYEIITDHVLRRKITEVERETPDEAAEYVKKMRRWIAKADIVVTETTYSDVSVGWEIAAAVEKGKPVVVLYMGDKVPHALKANVFDKLNVFQYNEHDMREVIADALDEASETSDVRFNFFISPKIGAYLDWITRHKRIPRAVYLRGLIDKEMQENQEYKEG